MEEYPRASATEVMLRLLSESRMAAADIRASVFLQKGLAVMLLQEPFRLPCAKPQLAGQLL